jgi:L-arabinose isomerase
MVKKYEFWFVVGSQSLYGPDVLNTVEARAKEMAAKMGEKLPYPLVFKGVVKTAAEGTQCMKDANRADECAGVLTWCHTFSPSKMWIAGLELLQKPWCHMATQYDRRIPCNAIDMDYMNLNQAAHGDREHGFIGARLRKSRKIIAGYWQDDFILEELGDWERSAVGAAFSRELKIIRFGDNMREVAVTEGDKIEALIRLGWQVDYWPVGHLVETMEGVSDAEIKKVLDDYESRYAFATDDREAVRYQAKEEAAIRKIMSREGANAFVTNFQDLYGLKELPGLAAQNIMADGMGFGAEGDWKVAAMTAIVKAMGKGRQGGTSFIEDYTYDWEPGNETELAAHMLEVCPTIAEGKARVEVHPLSIGDREPPARLVFDGKAGKAVVVTLVDMGGRMRMICQDIECIKPIGDMPRLPVARVMWKGMPDLLTGLRCWILAGGAHHSVISYSVTAQMLKDWANIMDIEFIHIDKDTTPEKLEEQLLLADLAWKLR